MKRCLGTTLWTKTAFSELSELPATFCSNKRATRRMQVNGQRFDISLLGMFYHTHVQVLIEQWKQSYGIWVVLWKRVLKQCERRRSATVELL